MPLLQQRERGLAMQIRTAAPLRLGAVRVRWKSSLFSNYPQPDGIPFARPRDLSTKSSHNNVA